MDENDSFVGHNYLKELKNSGRSVGIVDEIFEDKKINPYKKKQIIFGWYIDEYSKMRKDLYLDFREPIRIVVLGKTGSGKTMLLRAMTDRAFQSEYSCCHISDVKSDMTFSIEPVQDKFKHLLSQHERPTALNVKSYRPIFFEKMLGTKLPKDNFHFQISYKMLRANDLFLMFGKKISVKQRELIEKHFNKCDSLEELENSVRNDTTFPENSKTGLYQIIEGLVNIEFCGERFYYDWIENMNNGFIPVLNIESMREVPDYYYQTYVSVLLREIVNARKNGKLKKQVFIFCDEASSVIPKKREAIGKDEMLYQVNTARQFGVNIVFATQSPEDMPDQIVKQCRYLIVPSNIDFNDYRQLQKRAQEYEWTAASYKMEIDEVRHINKTAIKMGRRAWAVLDTVHSGIKWVYTYGPLSAHGEAA